MGVDAFSVPVDKRYFEDYKKGGVYEFGAVSVRQADVISFAERFDPQVFHTDPAAARDTIYGGLIASGWHTCAIMMRLFVDHYLSHVASLGSPGVDALQWLRPVRPGDRLSLRVTIVNTRRSKSRPDRGIVESFIEVLNQNRDVVMCMNAVNFLACRNP